ncbi:zinc finger protein 471-like isoform X2 [Maniola jurtina]|uniref:zinc finger protein 471-like isoform X2 n=1 Tax=Maniola jurtina TaxID=191418 RepID=UPI001E6864B4|nr:zinc finger protein 471-like isoform X2 [Maniola jurtina]
MRCCVAFCKNTSDDVSPSERKGISFHGFPSDMRLRAAWLRALGKQDSHLPDSAVVCSQHFLADDIYETESGLKQIVTGAIPSNVQVCMICLDTDSKMFLMSKQKLGEAYKNLTGQPLCDQGNLRQTVCVQCAQRLINFNQFRDKSLRARALMMDLVEKHKLITRQHVKMINRTKYHLKSNFVVTMLGPDPCDLYIPEEPSEDKQTESEATEHRVVVKNENYDSKSVDEEMVANEDNNSVDNVNDESFANKEEYFIDDSEMLESELTAETQDPLKCESAPFQCTLCSEEFVCELAYMQHVSMHIQNSDGDCGMSRVCKPHTAVSSSSSHSSLLTENRQAVQKLNDAPLRSTDSALTSDALLSAGIATSIENQAQLEDAGTVQKSKQVLKLSNSELTKKQFHNQCADTSSKTNTNKLTNCVVKLYDVFKTHNRHVLIRDKKLVTNRTTAKDFNCQVVSENEDMRDAIEDIAPFTNKVEVNKLNVSKTLQSETECSKSDNCTNNLLIEKKSFTCDLCGNMFKRKDNLVRHLKIHTDMSFACKLCPYKANRKSNFNQHMRTHTGEKSFSCELCEYKAALKRHLVSHMRTHTGDKPFSCELCEYKTGSKYSLVLHMRTHTGKKSFSCELCEYKAALKHRLIRHMRTHTGEKPFSCELCKYKTSSKYNLVPHMRSHTGEKPYSCKFCKYKSSRSSDLVTHMRTHTGDKPYSCKFCKYKSSQSGDIITHMRTHTGEKPYSCKFCNYKSSHNGGLVTHMRNHHTGEKPYSCKFCNYKSSQNSGLVTHMRTHTGEKPYSCKLCNYKSSRNSHLVSHMRTHTGEEEPYSCKLCKYKSSEKSKLVRHMRTHTGEKPYSCKLCKYKFSQNSGLVSHMRTHTGEKPFSCELCEYKAAHKRSLVIHMRAHQRKTLFL